MKIYRLAQLAELTPERVVELGTDELGAEHIGLRYQTLLPKERAHIAKASKGKEEIVFIVKGALKATVEQSRFPVSAGESFYSNNEIVLENCSDTEAAFLTAIANGQGSEQTKKSIVAESHTATSAAPPAEACAAGTDATATDPVLTEKDQQAEFTISEESGD
jgi:quercetin dioxygenase-like cupin family protein